MSTPSLKASGERTYLQVRLEISPLPTSHPSTFQRALKFGPPVASYRAFNLLMELQVAWFRVCHDL